ncbi:MAG: thioredoxin family protein [Prevotella sp.]|nr:thioredoxin family protein [Prevotella sp.]
MKRALSIYIFLLTVVASMAQMVDPVSFTSQLKTGSTADAEIVFSGVIDPGWHVYSTGLGDGGPIEAALKVNKLEGCELVGALQARGNEIAVFEELFGMDVRYFEKSVEFVQKIRFTKPEYTVDAYLEYGACSDVTCLPPQECPIVESGKSPMKNSDDKDSPDGETADGDETMASASADSLDQVVAIDSLLSDTIAIADGNQDIYTPVIDEMAALGDTGRLSDHSLWYIFIMGFLGGLLALLTPCVWPIIPMTVSFFLKRNKGDKRRGVGEAVIYGLSIIVIYLGLGLFFTAAFGSDALNALSTNAVFNVLLFLLLVVFALSFFGLFEIRLPSRWADSIDSKAARTSGFVSIFLMAFTLALVSFSCTAPIVGLLLVESVTSGSWVSPAVGMFGFALALALPFTLFALFPTWLKQMPRSGSWMNTIKVVLGFIELAFSLKFLSVADLAYGWNLMSREVFLILWILIFAAMGLYLLGVYRFPSDNVDGTSKRMPWFCKLLGIASILFAAYMVPGLWGAPVKAVSAFAPPMNTLRWSKSKVAVEARYTNYEEAIAAARQEGKPLLLDFTGYGCVNCRKMEAAVWTDPRVAERLQNDYILVSLYVDDRKALPKEETIVDEKGQTQTLKTEKDKWSWLQRYKFGANTQPFYVAVDPDGHALTPSRSYNEDISEYLRFLDEGLQRFKSKK